jgi:hypothetical protein
VYSSISAQANNASCRYSLDVFGLIDENSRRFYRIAKVRISDCSRLNNVDGALEQAFQVMTEPKVTVESVFRICGTELDERVDITPRRVERVCDGGAKEPQSTHFASAADVAEFVEAVGDEGIHRFA